MPAGRGASVPWEEVQAEDAETNSRTIGPCRAKWSVHHIEAEAIGRKAVVLLKTGDFVKFRPKSKHNSIVVRYSVPDAPGGGGADFTLGLYVNGKKATSLSLTSKYSWNYRGQLLGDPVTDLPDAQPHTFFDEAHFLFPSSHTGDTIELRRESGDAAAFYVIDLADFEDVAAPTSKPEGFISVEEYGIHPNDGIDHAQDLEKALFLNPNINEDPLRNERKLWFPPGKYIISDFKNGPLPLSNEGLDCHNCEIRGAGMWHTELHGRRAMFFCLGQVNEVINHGGCHFKDFRITGVTKTRSEEKEGPQKAFAGPMGSQSTIDNVWIEHVVAGIWVGNDPPYQARPTENLKITNCRIRNVYADGINFANGTSNSSVDNCHIRNSGDDAIAVWSVNWPDWVKEREYINPGEIRKEALNAPAQGVGHGNHFNRISVQMPWRANCFAVYGGHSNIFENSSCEDVLTYPGILVDNEFSPYDFGPGTTVFRNITLNRAGGTMFYEGTDDEWHHGALKFYSREGSVNDILAENIDIISPTYAGIEFRSFGPEYLRKGEKVHPDVLRTARKISNVTLNNIRVTNPGTVSLVMNAGAGAGVVNVQNVQLSAPFFTNNTWNKPEAFFIGTFSDQVGSPIQPLISTVEPEDDGGDDVMAKATNILSKRGLGMNSFFENAAARLPLSAEARAKLDDPAYTPWIPPATHYAGWKYKSFKTVLYPKDGIPWPGDGAQTRLLNCQMLSLFNSMAYQSPDYIKKIIKDLGNGTYEVSLFDPAGMPTTVKVNSDFLVSSDGRLVAAGGLIDKQPNWMSILEKAVMKYNLAYDIWPLNESIGGSQAFPSAATGPILTGDGNYFEREADSFKNAKELRKVVTSQLAAGKYITLGFSKKEACGNDDPKISTAVKHAYAALYPLDNSPLAALDPYGWDSKTRNFSHNGILDFNMDDNPQNFVRLVIISSGQAVTRPNTQDYVKAGFFTAPATLPTSQHEEHKGPWREFLTVVAAGLAALALLVGL